MLKAALQRVATKRDILFQEMSGELDRSGSVPLVGLSSRISEPATDADHRGRALFQVGKRVEIDADALVLRR